MRDPRYYFGNCFNSKKISVNELAAFTTDHLGRLTAHNGSGEWTARIAATSAAMSGLDSAFSDDLIKGAFRAARKQAKNGFRETLPGQVAKVLSFVRGHFGANAPEVTACAPGGLEPFRRAQDDEVENQLNKLVAGVTAVQATVGAPVVTLATDLKAAWMTIYTASEASSSDKALSEAEQRAARSVLQNELFTTLLALADGYRDQPEMLGLFMQPYLLGGPPLGTGPGGGGGGGGDGSSSSGPPPGSSSSSGPPMSSSSSSSSAMPPSSSSSSSGPPMPSSSSSSSASSSSSSSSF